MKTIIMAWRNLWRNRRRTVITSASILFAVFFALVMRSFQLGFYNHMITNAVETFSGFLQIQQKDYQYEPTLDNSFPLDDSLLAKLKNNSEIKSFVPRVETFALASSGNKTKGALILGVDPRLESGISNPKNQLVRYRFTSKKVAELKQNSDLPKKIRDNLETIKYKSYSNTESIALDLNLNDKEKRKYIPLIAKNIKYHSELLAPDDQGVLIADRLARFLNLNTGDTLVLLGQGYHGVTAANIFPVRGLVNMPNPELDNKLIYMTIGQAQLYSSLGDRVTSIAINLYDNKEKNMFEQQAKLSSEINNDNLVVRNWHEFNEVLRQQIQGDNQSGQVMLGLLYFIVFFGIFGTVLMMIHERYREFGVLVAVGMQKTKLVMIMIFELFFMGLLGVLSGTLLSLPILYIGHNFPIHLRGEMAQVMLSYGFDPVMPLAWIDTYMIWQGTIVALMVILASLYPLRKVLKIKAVDALRG